MFGHSSGAVLALEAARTLPDRIPKLALYEPPFFVDDSRPPLPEDYLTRLDELVSTGRRGDAVEFFMTTGPGVPAEAVAGMRQQPFWPSMEATPAFTTAPSWETPWKAALRRSSDGLPSRCRRS